MPQIDTTSYNKALKYPLPAPPAFGHGYQARKGAPSSVVIHTTNNRAPNTVFEQEARFLLDSADVSAHYLISKDGRIVQFLDPHPYAAWHAGSAIGPWLNEYSVGIELHVSVGERPTKAQRDAAAWLCARLMAAYGFASDRIETHRYVATPVGRKSDPEGWPNAEFYQWRAMLVSTAPDPWLGWGQAYPLDPAQRGYKVPQTWLRNTWLGEARSYELYTPDGLRSVQWFQQGWVVYEKGVDWAMAFKASKPVP
jgi:N-acetyl-anhydromuramyl-L-alanine amidase AmpD